jgi:hypothetical protein
LKSTILNPVPYSDTGLPDNVPVMGASRPESEFSGCPIYTGHFNVLEFDGLEFVFFGDD